MGQKGFSVFNVWTWLVVGAPLVIVIFFILTGTKNLSLFALTLGTAFLGLTYLVFPWLVIRFYSGQKIRQYFESRDTNRHWTDNIPTPILVLSILYIFFIIVLHILIMFKGIFPMFGVLTTGLKGIILLDISIVCVFNLSDLGGSPFTNVGMVGICNLFWFIHILYCINLPKNKLFKYVINA